jgi:hypothetical protein
VKGVISGCHRELLPGYQFSTYFAAAYPLLGHTCFSD